MRILVLSTIPTHPPEAGNRARILAQCAALKRAGHQVTFALVPQEDGDLEETARFFGDEFALFDTEPFRPRPSIPRRLIRRFRHALGLASAYRLRLDDWHDPRTIPWLRGLHRRHQFEAVMVNYVFQSRMLEAFPSDVLKVIETHDTFGDRHLSYLEAGMEPEWYSTSPKEEFRGLARADVVIAIQSEEATRFRNGVPPSTRVVTVHPYMEDLSAAAPCDLPRAVVVASSNIINTMGARRFLDGAFPIVRQAIPEFELVLAGNICNHFRNEPGVVCLGRVADLRTAYEAGALALNPVLFGTGFCIKTLESLAYGMPLVSTTTGCRGLESVEGSGSFIVVADDDVQGMAAAIIRVLQDPEARSGLRDSAKRFSIEWSRQQLSTLEEVFAAREPDAEAWDRPGSNRDDTAFRRDL